MDFIRALWRGEVALIKTYWIYGTLGMLLLFGIPSIIFEESGFYETEDPTLLIVVLAHALFAVVYTIFISVAIWRSATNYMGSAWWAGLAKVAVVIGVLRFIAEIVKEFK